MKMGAKYQQAAVMVPAVVGTQAALTVSPAVWQATGNTLRVLQHFLVVSLAAAATQRQQQQQHQQQ